MRTPSTEHWTSYTHPRFCTLLYHAQLILVFRQLRFHLDATTGSEHIYSADASSATLVLLAWTIRATATSYVLFSLSIPSSITLKGPVINNCESLPAIEISPIPLDGSDRDVMIFHRVSPSTGSVVVLLLGVHVRPLPPPKSHLAIPLLLIDQPPAMSVVDRRLSVQSPAHCYL